MIALWGWLRASGAALWVAAAGVLFAAIKLYGRSQRQNGREEIEREAMDNAMDAERSRARTDRAARGELLDDFHRD